MKKRVLATILAVCLIFSVMACMASASADFTVAEIISSKRICPGDVIDDNFIEAPEVTGPVYAEGWEIKYEDGEWYPYDGQPIAEDAGVFTVRYFVANADGTSYAYSNECTVIAKHNPKGNYEASGTDHWRVCADCGGECEKGGHDHLAEGATAANKVCTICGHRRTSQWTGLLAFWEWIMALIGSLIG